MFECITAGLVLVIFILLLFKGLNVSITVNVENKVPESVMEVNDLYNSDGELLNKENNAVDFNEALKDIHKFMVDAEE